MTLIILIDVISNFMSFKFLTTSMFIFIINLMYKPCSLNYLVSSTLVRFLLPNLHDILQLGF